MSIIDSIRTFFSPSARRTQQKRDKPFKTPALPPPRSRAAPRKETLEVITADIPERSDAMDRLTPASSARYSMSPGAKVASWNAGTLESAMVTEHRRPFATPSIARDSPPPPDLGGMTLENEDEEDEDEEMGDIKEEEEEEEEGEEEEEQDGEDEDLEDSFDVGEDTIIEEVEEDGVKEKEPEINIEEERAKMAAKGDELRAEGWSEDSIAIYSKIASRRFDPHLPVEWQLDFRTLPWVMFTSDYNKCSILAYKSSCGGSKALHDLLMLGGYIRDARRPAHAHKTCDFVAKRGIKTYMKWAFKDAAVHGPSNIPTLSIVAGNIAVSASYLQSKLLLTLEKKAADFQKKLQVRDDANADHGSEIEDAESLNPPSVIELVHPVPTLYGIVVSHTTMAFVSYEAAGSDNDDDGPQMRQLGIFDYSESHYDVWNGLAIAQMVCHAREGMRKISPFMPFVPDPPEEPDPDL